MGKQVVKGVNDLLTTHSDLVKNHWNYEKNTNCSPTDFSAGSCKYVFWKCDKGHSFKARIFNVTHSRKGMCCPVCRNVLIEPGINDLATTHPDLLKEWDYEKNIIRPNQINAASTKKVWWKCIKHSHSWQTSIVARARLNTKCPICANQKLLVGYNDTKTVLPEIVKYWDYKKNMRGPESYIGVSTRKVYLLCSKGHSYSCAISDFKAGKRCPYCAGRRVLVGFNDLKTTEPELSREWNYEKNGEVKPENVTRGSDRKVWWKCEKGHEWQAVISSRSNGNGCPFCVMGLQTSKLEKIVFESIKEHYPDAVANVRLEEMKPFELDVYIPSKHIAVEYDGKRWHQDIQNDLAKDKQCKKNGITLFRIREKGCLKLNSSSIVIETLENPSYSDRLFVSINELLDMISRR